MVSKIDQCMLDLMAFHGEGDESDSSVVSGGDNLPASPPSATVTTSATPMSKSVDVPVPKESVNEPASSRRQAPGVLDSASSANEVLQIPPMAERPKNEGRFL